MISGGCTDSLKSRPLVLQPTPLGDEAQGAGDSLGPCLRADSLSLPDNREANAKMFYSEFGVSLY